MIIIPNNQEEINRTNAISELLRRVRHTSRGNLMALKRKLSKECGIKILTNSEILSEYRRLVVAGKLKGSPGLVRLLRKRAIRTLSGVASITVATRPYACPGDCLYCPNEKGMPKSYLSNEPAIMRAIRCGFEPYKQVEDRLKALEANGHEPAKIELIVIGGTWSALPAAYKYWFVKECFRAANEYGRKTQNSPAILRDKAQNYNLKFKNVDLKIQLMGEQKRNETAEYRIIGLTVGTRPDYIDEKELRQLRELGCTRVEVGVQAIDDKILKLNKRGHDVAEIIRATKLLKDYGFKVTYHLMPGLLGSSPKKDLAMFKRLFADERFQPDQLKIYPTVVTRGSKLYQRWRTGRYKPYSDRALQNLLVACKKAVPPYVRIIRLVRDIPAGSIIAGNKVTNLRQIMKDRGVKCRCIRCREAKGRKLETGNWKLEIREYEASGGEEYFIQATDRSGEVLYGFCRLRLAAHNVIKGAALLRELHVYGELVPIGARKKVQHAGLGKLLMRQAEKIARENTRQIGGQGFKKMAVIAGVGARGYYRKLGYRLKNSYMVKNLV
jgi:elongator complex protein 3